MAALAGGVAVVTGGGSGMGRGISLRFAQEGARVVVVGRTRDKIDETVNQIRAAGGDGVACVADVAVEEDVRRMVGVALTEYGRLDFAANVAGVAHEPKLRPSELRHGAGASRGGRVHRLGDHDRFCAGARDGDLTALGAALHHFEPRRKD